MRFEVAKLNIRPQVSVSERRFFLSHWQWLNGAPTYGSCTL